MHLLWGALMLTLTSAGQAAHLHQVWAAAGVHARRLPMSLPGEVPSLSGIDPRLERPGVIMRLWGRPDYTLGYTGAYQQRDGRTVAAHATITLGGITWNVYDQIAHRSTLGILANAAKVSPAMFG